MFGASIPSPSFNALHVGPFQIRMYGLVARRRGLPALVLMDVVAPALPLAQAIGRVGNWFNQELFGRPTSLPWALRISAAHRPAGYTSVATYHPTFLYEALWN